MKQSLGSASDIRLRSQQDAQGSSVRKVPRAGAVFSVKYGPAARIKLRHIKLSKNPLKRCLLLSIIRFSFYVLMSVCCNWLLLF
jgi:hypothetical protein